MGTIQPTHRCFDDALEYVNERVRVDPFLAHGRRLLVVHAIVVAPNGPHVGERFAHAWVEERDAVNDVDLVWDAGILDGHRIWYAAARDEYYTTLQPQDVTKYTIRNAYEQHCRTNMSGPWKPEYLALCSDTRRVMGSL